MTDSLVQEADDPNDTSSSLLERIRTNSTEAWALFVRLYRPIIYKWCRRWGCNEDDAADIGQDVFRKIATKIGTFRKDNGKASFRRWLKTIAVNTFRDALRALPQGGEGTGGSDANGKILEIAEAVVEDSENDSVADDERTLLRGIVDEVLSRCKVHNRQAFLQIVMEEKSPAEVAQNLGMTTNAVYLAVSHIKSRIKRELDGLSESMIGK